MITWMLLACTDPVDVELKVVDAVQGVARGDVPLVWSADDSRCTREGPTDGAGRARVELCPDTHYEVRSADAAVVVWPAVEGPAETLPDTVQVLDRTDGLALVGGGVVPLPPTVDVRRVQPRGHDRPMAMPAVLPVVLPTWGAGQGLFVPEGGAKVEAVPLVRTETLELTDGGPLQPWWALGAKVDQDGAEPVAPPAPEDVLEVPGGVVWRGLAPGTYALWDGQAERVPLLKVE